MKLDYSVLWIEDQLKGIKNFKTRLRIKFKKSGFNFHVHEMDSISSDEIKELGQTLSTYNPYDLIFFDFDLGESGSGVDLARELRRHIFTDMIFYTGNSNDKLREELFKQRIDGVFIVNRGDFVNKSWEIIEDQIKKFCDINSIRGVILDEMSKIDIRMRQIFSNKYNDMDDQDKNDHLKSMKRIYSDKSKKQLRHKEDICIDSLPDYITNPISSEFETVRRRLCKLYSDNLLLQDDGLLKSYQKLRNNFAHNDFFFDEKTGFVYLSNDPDHPYKYSDFEIIRKELLTIQEELEKLNA